MENFVKYIKAITANPLLPRGQAKMTTTIVMCELDTAEGIYRSLLPSYVFTGIPDYRMLIVGLTTKIGISQNDRDFNINETLIRETDHFVFPFVSYPITPIINKIKETAEYIGKKTPIIFSYYIDCNFYQMTESYPYASQYKEIKMIQTIEQNIIAANQVIVTNKELRTFILEKMKEKYSEDVFKTPINLQPLFILPELTKTDYSNGPEKDKTKILIIGDEYHFSDFNFIKGILIDLKTKYKKSLEIYILGWDGKRKDQNFLGKLDFTYWPRTEFYTYFQAIRHIAPDALIIPAKVNKFNSTSKNCVKYLEFAYLGIPVIAPDIEPYRELISNNQNGFLAGDKESYMFQIETLITDKEKFAGVLDMASALASLDYNISSKENISLLTQIYFPPYGTSKS